VADEARRGPSLLVVGSKSSTNHWPRNTLTCMLSAEDRSVLEFERGWWLEPGPKDQAIELRLGLPAAVYYEHLIRIVSLPAASRLDPLTVARVTAMIESDVAVGEAVS
jgi:Protein of unknown function (DUF3263)